MHAQVLDLQFCALACHVDMNSKLIALLQMGSGKCFGLTMVLQVCVWLLHGTKGSCSLSQQ